MPEDHHHTIKEEDEDEIVLSDGEEGFENPLADLLVTSEGENIADGVVNALDRIGNFIETQNKILIKLYSVLSKSKSPPTA